MLFDSVADPVFVHDPKGKILAFNTAVCKKYGYTPSRLKDMTVAGIDTPEDAAGIPGRISRLLKTGHVRFETHHRHKNGAIIGVDVNAVRITWNGGPAVMSICRDITERRRLENIVKENEKTLQTIFETAKDAIFIKDREGRYLKLNKACADVFLIKPEEAPGKTDFEVLPREMAQLVTKIDKEVVRTGRSISRTYEQVLPSGRYYFNTVKTPLRDAAGRIIGVLGIARDITGVKKLEAKLALAKVLEAVRDETRPIAHDFNNVLAAINGYATMMEEELPDSNPMKQEIGQIIGAVKRATELTTKFQALARNPRLAGQTTKKNVEPPARTRAKPHYTRIFV
ncbi:MAG: hypothetical protein COT18_00740 [Elusimicrobia bacterium CG08_land_8_20_14_0_20_59_10]|nr:MAG: hypothetical protein COT18_00740 [Elusimicrobia bacterium CG08_land_8_20_14_0_20_59_10]